MLFIVEYSARINFTLLKHLFIFLSTLITKNYLHIIKLQTVRERHDIHKQPENGNFFHKRCTIFVIFMAYC